MEDEPELELLAPVRLNIVCFRHKPAGMDAEELDAHNLALEAELTEQEVAEALDITDRTVRRDWERARLLLSVWLKR